MNLREIFGKDVSSSAFKLIDGELTIVGKWCRIALDDDGEIDLWICNTADMLAGLGTLKLRNVISRINYRVGSTLRELNGEAWGKVRGKEIILENLPVLGIKKKRRVSDEQRKQMTEQLKKYHAG
jgi:hypothetical protein